MAKNAKWRMEWILVAGLLLTMLPLVQALPQTQSLKGQVVTDKGASIPNAVCSLNGRNLPQGNLQATTDERGNFDFPALMPGRYSLTCAAVGREPVSKTDIVVISGKLLSILQVILPPEIRASKQVITVHATAPGLAANQAAPPSTFSAHQLMTLPLAELKFKAALPLVPGVVRTPDGKLNIKGTPEEQGLLLVDGTDLVDPVTGAFSVEVPIDDIEELQVYKSPYQVQYGHFSGGLTVIQTKPPLDHWHWELNDVIPDVFIEQGHIQGIQGDAPRFYLTGPLIKDRLNFSESFIYDLNRAFIEGLPWPKNISRREGISSFTQFQLILSPRNLLSTNVRVFPARREFDNISALVPEPASSNYGQRGYSIGGVDRYMRKSGGILSTLFQATEFDTYAHGQGPEPMLITPNGYGGNYFNAYQRFANQEEFQETYEFRPKTWAGEHHLQIGGEYFRRAYTGTSASNTELITNTSGNILGRINFSGLSHLSDEDTQFEAYGQDHWVVNNFLNIDYGLRFSNENIGSPAAFAPRVGFVYSPSRTGRTVIHGGAGIFYNRIAMLAADYAENPSRVISLFAPDGAPLGPPQIYLNAYRIISPDGKPIAVTHNNLGATPYDRTWSMEIDQELRANWLLRASYLGSRGLGEFLVNQEHLANGSHAYLLTNNGASRYQEFETTLRWRTGEKANVNVSYVHSTTRGDLNTLGALYVPFEQPVIRPNYFADLPADIPNRVITWAEFAVPWGLTLSPVFDIHTGFPWSSYDAYQNYVGPPQGRRLPRFYSLDFKISKDFHIPFLKIGFFKRHKFRGAFQVYDVTNHLNPVDVYNNVDSPFYAHFIGFQHMTFNTYFDLIY
ncbi:MAG: TonB-dependent receptor [Terriglobia bacterium]